MYSVHSSSFYVSGQISTSQTKLYKYINTDNISQNMIVRQMNGIVRLVKCLWIKTPNIWKMSQNFTSRPYYRFDLSDGWKLKLLIFMNELRNVLLKHLKVSARNSYNKSVNFSVSP